MKLSLKKKRKRKEKEAYMTENPPFQMFQLFCSFGFRIEIKGPRKAGLVCKGTLKIDPIMKV